MTTLASTRTALTSRQRRAKSNVQKEGYAAIKKLLEVHGQAAEAYRQTRAGEYLSWQMQRLSALHGEDGR